MESYLEKEIISTETLKSLRSSDDIRESSERVYALQMIDTPTVLGLNLYELSSDQLKNDLENITSLNCDMNRPRKNYINKIQSLKPTNKRIEMEVDLI